MNTYYQLPDEKKKQMCLDVEPHITLSYFKVEKNFKVLSAKNTHLEEKFNNLLEYLRTKSIEVPKLFYLKTFWISC